MAQVHLSVYMYKHDTVADFFFAETALHKRHFALLRPRLCVYADEVLLPLTARLLRNTSRLAFNFSNVEF